MRYERLVLGFFAWAIWILSATVAQAVVTSFDQTQAIVATTASGYSNTLNANASGDGGSGSTSGTMVGNNLLELQGTYDSAANTVSVTGAAFVQQSGVGQLTTSPSSISMKIKVLGITVETATISNLALDLTSQGTIATVSGGAFTTPSSALVVVNGGSANATGLTGYSRDFSSSPDSQPASGYNVSLQPLGTPSVSGNLASFQEVSIMPINVSQSQSGFTLTMSGTLRSVGTYYARAPATYTWTAGSNSWSNGAAWNYNNYAPASYDSIAMTNSGTIDLGGGSQSIINVGSSGSGGIVGTIQNGSLAYTGDIFVKSGTLNVNLSNSGGSGRLWVGGNSGATVYLGGTNDTTYTDSQATIIGHSTTGAAGTVKLLSVNALNGANQDTQVFSGTLDLNGQWGVRSRTIDLFSGSSSALVNNSGSDAYTSANISVSDGSILGGTGNLWLGGTVGGGAFTKTGGGWVVLFGANTYTGTTISAGTVYVGAGGTSGTLGTGAVSNSGSLLFNRTDTVTVGNAISGSGSVSQTASGTTILTGANSYGATNINTGTLQIGNGGTSGTLGSGAVTDSTSLVFSRSDSITVGNAISGGGSLTKNAGGTVVLTGANSYGATTINAGTLQIGNGGTNGSLGTGAVTDNASLVFNRSDSPTVSNAISGGGSVTINDGSTVTFTGANSYGTTNITSGTLQIGNGGTSGSLGTGAVADNSWLEFNRSDSVTVGNAISGSGYLWMAGTGTLTLTGANSYNGMTYITSGALQVGNGGASGSLGTGAVSNSTSLVFNRSDTITVGNAISGGGSVTKNGAGTVILTGANSYGATTINTGTLQVGNGTTTGSLGTGAVTNNGALVFNPNSTIVVANAISGSGSLTQGGPGGLTLTGANSYTGTTTINSNCALQVGNNGTTGTLGSGAVTNNGWLYFYRTDSLTVANAIGGSGSLIDESGISSTVILTGNNTYSGTTSTTGTLQIGNGAATGSLGAGAVTDNGALVFNRSDTPTVSNAISGIGALTQNGSGTVYLTGGNSYTGATNVNTGALNISNATALGTAAGGTVVANGAALQIQGSITTTYAEALTLNGVGMSSTGALRNISGNNTYTGLVTLGSGSVRINSDSGTLSLSGGINGGGQTLTIGGNGNTLVGGSITNLGGLIKDSLGTLTLSGANTYSGTTTVGGGTLQIGNGGTSGSLGTGAVTDNGLLAFNRTDFVTVNNAISGNSGGSLAQNGSGTTVLTGANSYGGTTTISAGALQIGYAGTAGSLGTGAVTDNASLVFNRSDSITVGNAISGSGSLTQNGSGTVILTGANSYAGTTINSGTVQIGNGGTSGTLGSGAVNNPNGALTFNRSDSVTVGNAISGGGTLTQNGSGTVVLTGSNTYSGRTTVAAGAIELGTSAQSPVLTGGGANIQAGKMIFDYTPGNDPASNIKAMLAASYSASRFASGQIYSSTENTTTGLGWIDNTTTHQVTVARALYGDSNLDGQVNVSDLAVLAANFRKTVTGGWAAGDFNYDGVVNVLDLSLLAANYRHSLSSDIGADISADYPSLDAAWAEVTSGGLTTVPEPTSLAMLLGVGLVLLGIGLARWRRR